MAVMARRTGGRRRRCVAGGRGGGLRVPHDGRQDGMCLLCGFKTRMRWSLFKQKSESCFAFTWEGLRLNSFIHSGFAFRPPCTQTRVARYLSTSAARTAAAPQATQERRFSSYSENSTQSRAPRGALVSLVLMLRFVSRFGRIFTRLCVLCLLRRRRFREGARSVGPGLGARLHLK